MSALNSSFLASEDQLLPRLRFYAQVSKLISLIPEKLFSRLSKSTGVDYQVKKLYGRSMFYLLLLGILRGDRTSLRSLEDCYSSVQYQVFAGLERQDSTRYNSLSDRLRTMKVSFFSQLHSAVFRLFRKHYDSEPAGRKYSIHRVDSTMVAEAARKLKSGMCVGRKKDGKKQVKYTIDLQDLFPASVEIFSKQEELSEDKTLAKLILKRIDPAEDNIVVFDAGVQSRDSWNEMEDIGIQFVTRVKPNAKYEVGQRFSTPKGSCIANLVIESDELVYLFNQKRKPTHPFRLIRTKNKQAKSYYFLTNRFDLPAKEIILLYRKRWDIEVFFRFLKQELNLKHLMSMNENGIQIILYMTLIAAMLILVFKKMQALGYKTARRRFLMGIEEAVILETARAIKRTLENEKRKPQGP